MCDVLLVAVVHARNELLKEIARFVLCEVASGAHSVEELAAGGELENDA